MIKKKNKLINSVKNNKINIIKKNSILNYFLDKNDKKIIKNIIIYCLHTSPLTASLEKATRILNSLNLNSLFKNDTDYHQLLKEEYNKKKSKYKKSKFKEPILSFIVKKDIQLIPEEKLICPSKKQKIKPQELEFILKSISHKILQNWYNNSKDYYILSSNWFLSEGLKEKYYKETKRKLNLHKFYRITELLFEYNLIIKKNRWDEKTKKYKPTLYKLGDNNFYKRRISF